MKELNPVNSRTGKGVIFNKGINKINFHRSSLAILIAALASGVFGALYPEHAHYILLLISLLLIAFGVKNLLPYFNAKKWIKSTATIRSLKETYELVQESEYYKTKYYYPLVEYFYSYNNSTYTGTCVTFEKQNMWISGYNSWGDKISKKEKPWSSWKENNQVTVYINKKSPHQSALLPFLSQKMRSHHLALIASGVLIFIAWVLLKYYNITIHSG